jgi:uncharacterized protein YkwD
MTWQWLAIGVGGIVLLLALFFGGRALLTPSPTPVPPTVTVAAMPSLTITSPLEETGATPSPQPDSTSFVAPDIPALQRLMHELVNEDRRSNGLSPVAWDEMAAVAGTQHATEMAQYGYISHYNLDGYGPDYRYSLAGGLHNVRENVHLHHHGAHSAPQSAEEWEQWVREAQENLMGSEGHRANILSPEHTHVGVGIAYGANGDQGYLAISQEFVNQYVSLQPLPHSVNLGDTIDLLGWLSPEASEPVINLAYEPLPTPRSLEDLEPETYSSSAEIYSTPPLNVAEDGQLTASFTLNNDDQPGLYHIRIWVETKFGQVQAVDLVIRAQ